MRTKSSSGFLQALVSSSWLRSIFILSSVLLIYLIVSFSTFFSHTTPMFSSTLSVSNTILPSHLLFGIAASSRTWHRRRDYLRAWWRPGISRGIVFIDSMPLTFSKEEFGIPPIRISANTSRFPFSHSGGQRSGIRIARIAKELIDSFDGKITYGDVRWIVLGDDDTVFFLENLARTLAKYDWEQWYYIGSFSESAGQNAKHFFDMAFGGGGFAISYPLAKALSKVMDSCLMRYGHLFGSDARVFACLAELGVGLTREPGFHQVDLRGDLFGFLSTHPLPPLISLHHLDSVNPLFPNRSRSEAILHLLKAVNADPGRILQQAVCYDRSAFRTVSVSWGFTVQVFEGNEFLADLLKAQLTFSSWKRGKNSSNFMFNTREIAKDPCKRAAIFFLESLFSSVSRTESNYSRLTSNNCLQNTISAKGLKQITVFSTKYDTEIGKAMRRHCCDVLDSSDKSIMNISIRKCKDDELIAMNP